MGIRSRTELTEEARSLNGQSLPTDMSPPDRELTELILVNRQPPTKKYIRKRSDEASMALKDCFDSTDWEVLYSAHGEDVASMTTCVTDDINFCVNNTSCKEGTMFSE